VATVGKFARKRKKKGRLFGKFGGGGWGGHIHQRRISFLFLNNLNSPDFQKNKELPDFYLRHSSR